ncbi:MAG: UDPGP type 1 family protein [Opitutales bacterium]
MKYEELKERFTRAGQEHVFGYWDELEPVEREILLNEAGEIDMDELESLLGAGVEGDQDAASPYSGELEPPPYISLPEQGGNAKAWAHAAKLGEAVLEEGKVAAFTVAGGQGTRLGFNGPKGTFPVTPIKRKSLFQVFAEKILAGQRDWGRSIPWFIMTSHANHEETETFFQNNSFFGLPPQQVFLFRQGRMPAVDFNGKILLEGRGRIAMSPDGHGGSLRALKRSGSLERMEDQGIEVISYFQVDNPLARILDPAFIGFHVEAGSSLSSKMLPKAYAEEKMGVFCRSEGKLRVVEYSDLPPEVAERRNEDGRLVFDAGNMAIHLFSPGFVEKMAGGAGGSAGKLPFHKARKKIPCLTPSGEFIEPEKPNGIKFEMFVFDALPHADNPIVVETCRVEEFAPVKNAEGNDSPETCRENQLKLFARWFDSVGQSLPVDGNGVPKITVEISPLFAWGEDSFRRKWNSLEVKPEPRDGLYLEG